MVVASHLRLLAAAAVALLALTACGGDDPAETPTPSATAPPTVGLGNAPTTAPAPTTKPPAPPAFPSGARQYAEAILAAWKQKQLDRLGDLSTAEVQDQIVSIPGPPNQNWHFNRCDGAAGSTHCAFTNDTGDVVTLKLSNALLSKAHAATGVALDQTEFLTDAIAYVKHFVGAWQSGNLYRMRTLANQAEVDYFTHYTPPEPGYFTCSDGAAGSTYVHLYNTEGMYYVIRVSNAALGAAHAITAHATPPPAAPAFCP